MTLIVAILQVDPPRASAVIRGTDERSSKRLRLSDITRIYTTVISPHGLFRDRQDPDRAESEQATEWLLESLTDEHTIYGIRVQMRV